MSHPDTPDSPVDRARQEANHAGQRLADDAQRAGQAAADTVRDEARGRAERAREGVAGEVSGIASALRSAADEARTGSPQERTFGFLADSLADAADSLSGRNVEQIAGEVSSFARRNPVAFLGGAALAGFAATRFVRASAEAPRGTDANRDDANLPARSSRSLPDTRRDI